MPSSPRAHVRCPPLWEQGSSPRLPTRSSLRGLVSTVLRKEGSFATGVLCSPTGCRHCGCQEALGRWGITRFQASTHLVSKLALQHLQGVGTCGGCLSGWNRIDGGSVNVATGINGSGLPSTGQQCTVYWATMYRCCANMVGGNSLWSLLFIHRSPESFNLTHPNAGVQERARRGSGVLLHFAQDRVLPRWILQHRYHPHNSKQARARLVLKTTPRCLN